MDKKQIDDILQLLEKYELSIAVLYDAFAAVVPKAKESWKIFADEERMHAHWISQLCSYYQEGKIGLEQLKFTSQATKAAIAYIDSQAAKVSKERPNLKQCVNIAINIEKSLLENPFFKVFKLNAVEAQRIKAKLEEATISHVERLVSWREQLAKT